MTDMSMILHFLFSGVATAGFAVFFNAPLYLLLPAGITGGIGWIVYVYLFNFTTNAVFAGFIAAALVSACSETLARKLKQPAIVFVIPGILPLIPGIGLYNTMLSLIQKLFFGYVKRYRCTISKCCNSTWCISCNFFCKNIESFENQKKLYSLQKIKIKI